MQSGAYIGAVLVAHTSMDRVTNVVAVTVGCAIRERLREERREF